MNKEHDEPNIDERVKICYKFFGMDVEIGLREDSYMGGAVLRNVDHCCPHEDYDCPAQYVSNDGKLLCSRIYEQPKKENKKNEKDEN